MTEFLQSTDAFLGAFGACHVLAIMKAVKILGMEQARTWKMATLNEFRKFFQLKPRKTVIEINLDPNVAETLEALYGKIELLELYLGLVAKQATLPDTIGQGL